MSQLVDKVQPFTKLLHEGVTFNWDEHCETNFRELKAYLASPPILMAPIYGKLLLLYISTTATSLGVLLAQEDETRKERPIYYISRTLVAYELNYSIIEKACLAVVFASQKLRHYMLSHIVKLIAKIDPLKYLLSTTAWTGRLEKWVLILSEFDIEYVKRRAIKGQVLADQLADSPLQDDTPLLVEFPDETIMHLTEHPWKLYFDGSLTQQGSGVGVLFTTPQGYKIPKS